jgi:hypothetical protein
LWLAAKVITAWQLIVKFLSDGCGHRRGIDNLVGTEGQTKMLRMVLKMMLQRLVLLLSCCGVALLY